MSTEEKNVDRPLEQGYTGRKSQQHPAAKKKKPKENKMNVAEMNEIGMSRKQYQSTLGKRAYEIKRKTGFELKECYALAKKSFEVRLAAARRTSKENNQNNIKLLKLVVENGYVAVYTYSCGEYRPQANAENTLMRMIGCHEFDVRKYGYKGTRYKQSTLTEYTLWQA